MSLQPNEVLIIAFVALIVLGPTRLPGAIRSIGRFLRQVRDFSTTVRQEMDATLSPPKVEPASSPNPPTPPDPPEAPGAQGEGESSQPDEADPAVDRSTSDGPA
ncbi:twin-arginine translocase TatA/TatE family subunit [Candidatus Poriferisodalis sp.]|uniref:twin-arginine translocase TatA/TatE family subunit n=1 Tax=Candidatus Poriferisodalis sp. TaxID=3101277 RepID=UPI003B51A913